MTFYPINKPTEPGWYWFRIGSRLAQPFPLKVTIEEGELWGHSVMPPSPGTPFKARVEKFVGQWYGPKLELPNPEEKRSDDVPRRFRWRALPPSDLPDGTVGFGIYRPGRSRPWVTFGHHHSEGWGEEVGDHDSIEGVYEITEWLDPEPKR